MPDYTQTKSYKDLVNQSDILRERFNQMIESLPNKEELQLCFKEYREIQETILEAADQEINDIEWDRDEEIDELKDEVESLEIEIQNLKEKYDVFENKSLEDEMKIELFQAAMKKYTLVQLEERLGNRFQLM